MLTKLLAPFLKAKEDIRGGELVGVVARFSDLLLAFLIVTVLGLMIIPLPTLLLDILLTLQMTLALSLIHI